ncbi:hypothetical protein ACE0DR_15345 [Azotobacter sp. CWF10]
MKFLAFRVFVDEFENLLPRHREIVCDAIKHPQQRMAVHIAHKREAVTDFKTSGQERIVETHDIRTIDIERLLSEDGNFELLAAELFFSGSSRLTASRPVQPSSLNCFTM